MHPNIKHQELTVTVGSQNPAKISAAENAFRLIFPTYTIHMQGVDAPSGVSDQPMTSSETRQGAINRTHHCQTHYQSDYFISLEGGVDLLEDGPVTFAYIAIAQKGQNKLAIGRGAMLPIPLSVYESLCQGEELGGVIDTLFNDSNLKQKGGAIGQFTNGLTTRSENYSQAILLAMASFINPHLY